QLFRPLLPYSSFKVSLFPLSTCFQRREQVPDFIIHLFGARDSLSDLIGKQLTVALTEAVNGGLRRHLREPKAHRGGRVGDFPTVTEEKFLEHVESSTARAAIEFLAQTPQHSF